MTTSLNKIVICKSSVVDACAHEHNINILDLSKTIAVGVEGEAPPEIHYINTLSTDPNNFYITLSGSPNIRYSFDSSNSIHVDEVNRIKTYIDDTNPDGYDYQELENKFIVYTLPQNTAPGVWKSVNLDWVSSAMNFEGYFPKDSTGIFFASRIDDATAYTAKHCTVSGNTSVTLNTTTEKYVYCVANPCNVNGTQSNTKPIEISGNLTIEPIDGKTSYVVVFEK
jgi:hypothetical protein